MNEKVLTNKKHGMAVLLGTILLRALPRIDSLKPMIRRR